MINRAKAVWQFITSPDYSRTVSILALLVIVLAIPLTVFIAQKQQEIRQRAEVKTCPDTYDGTTFSSLKDEQKAPFLATYDDQAEAQWIKQHNEQLVRDNPQTANDGKTLFGEECLIIRSFYSAYPSNAPQQWVNQHNATLPTTARQTSEPCDPNTPCLNPVPNIAAPNDASKNLYCRKIGNDDTAGVYTGGEYQWVTEQTGKDLCSAQEHRGRTARCAGQIYYCDPIERKPGNWVTSLPQIPTATPLLSRPPTATPIILPLATATPILTPTPTPVVLCGHRCNSFTSGSKTSVGDCDFSGQYLDINEVNGVCTGSCAQIPVGYRKTPDGCSAVSTTTGLPRLPAPPSSPGDYNPPAQPTATPTPGGTLASLSVSLPGIGNRELDVRTPRRASRAIRLSIFNQNNLNNDVGGGSGSLTFDGRAFSGTVSLGSILTGDYLIKVEMEMNTLKTLIPGTQHIVAGTTNQLSAVTLIPGDLDKNNILDIRDYNMLVSVFGGGHDTPADLNDDGVVNGTDYNIFLRGLKEKRQGD